MKFLQKVDNGPTNIYNKCLNFGGDPDYGILAGKKVPWQRRSMHCPVLLVYYSFKRIN